MISRDVYVKAFIATLIVFSLGLAMGWWLDQTRYAVAQAELEDLKIQADEARVSLLYFQSFKDSPSFCANYEEELRAQLGRVGALGERLEALQNANKLGASFYKIKKQYALFNAEFWMHVQNYNEYCGSPITTILYFYPENSECAECALQAAELNAVKADCPDKAWVFALPVDMDLGVVNALRNQYGVTGVPAVVVNGEAFEGFASRQELSVC
ncbi:hypothetical protein COX85_00495 [Candidatus Micrarchaeota archaeon CG_4_10_14_0_2_um_filter_55_9]|nr:MAG: hypothetical protein AUJ15_03820 [Candidatus Micrarchaeota archaeon CG1_02_55_41]PIO02230.1 MAG: hypothetical protein COT57_03835 [Candidatus Micrarchaeota archaeon CG09_land_8_20_14_0_10_55_25]PIZ92075.1 MAG: hypothetical protein COX85_00495 [Candidatus Micrarchaeota archaeon CG_4_10_14_0_2_um_filter_55_9]PJD01081.1 MAG: hypothetical protein COU38_02960 [Candidatus Micrarchaeota archaeon CG10_big_fil_rev_8_21_14_0_10_54_18]